MEAINNTFSFKTQKFAAYSQIPFSSHKDLRLSRVAFFKYERGTQFGAPVHAIEASSDSVKLCCVVAALLKSHEKFKQWYFQFFKVLGRRDSFLETKVSSLKTRVSSLETQFLSHERVVTYF